MNTADQPEILHLWPNDASDSEGWAQGEQETFALPASPFQDNPKCNAANVDSFSPNPAIATGTAIIICSSGAFHSLAIDHEGTDVARWLNI